MARAVALLFVAGLIALAVYVLGEFWSLPDVLRVSPNPSGGSRG